MITTPTDVAELGTVLGIWAHPDDEAYLSGGLMALAADAGSRVACVTATRGERGTVDPVAWPPARLAAERTAELAECLSILGVREHYWLDYPDGGCASVDQVTAVDRLVAVIDEVRPDTVLSFGTDGYTGHADHRTIAGWAQAAVDRAGNGIRLLQAAVTTGRHARWAALSQEVAVFEDGYPVLAPDDALQVRLALAPEPAHRKVRALAAQRTQTAALIEFMGIATYTAWVGEECFVEAAGLRGRTNAGRSSRARCAAPPPG